MCTRHPQPWPSACFTKVPKLFGPISGATIPFISSQRRDSKSSNFAILLVFLELKTCSINSFSKQADCSLKTGFLGPKMLGTFEKQAPSFNCEFDAKNRLRFVYFSALLLEDFLHVRRFSVQQKKLRFELISSAEVEKLCSPINGAIMLS